MKIDLDDIERKARAATPGPWRTETTRGDRWHVVSPGGFPIGRDPAGGPANFESHTASHIAASSPPVTLALVARIRELEAAHRDLGDAFQMLADAYEPDVPLHRGRIDGLAKLLRKGAALP